MGLRLAPAFVCVLLLAAGVVDGQVPTVLWPFTGQGTWPPELGRAAITIDIHLDRFISVQETEQSWRGLHRFHLSWRDPRALGAVRDSTTAWYNNNSTGTDAMRTPFGTCALPCDASMSFETGCCDRLWLPQIDLPNLLDFDYQVNPPRWRIWVEPLTLPDGSTTGLVHWTVRLDGTWFSPYDFRAWPLEHQHLLLEMQPANTIADRVSLVLGSTSPILNTPHTKGVDLAGWRVSKVTPRLYDTTACYQLSNTTSWAFDFDPVTGEAMPRAIVHANFYTQLGENTTATVVPASSCDSLGNVEGTNQYGPYVLVIDTQIQRDQTFYVLIYIVPLVIVDLLVFVVYAMDRTNIEARMGVVITLVLALSALQFTYTFPPANYLNIVQQLSLASFVLFGLVAICCIITSSIARIHERSQRYEAQLVAAGLKSLSVYGQTMHGMATNPSKASLAGGDSQVSLDLAGGAPGYPQGGKAGLNSNVHLNAAAAAAPPPPSSGLFFGSGRGSDRRDRVVINGPPMAPAPAPAHGYPQRPSAAGVAGGEGAVDTSVFTQLPPITEMASDRHPYPHPAARGGAGGQPVAEGTLWHSLTQFAHSKPQQQGQGQRQGRPSSDGGDGEGGESPGFGDGGQTEALAPPRISRFQKGRRTVSRFISNVHTTSRNVTNKISADEAYAQLVARRVDIFTSLLLFSAYVLVLATLIPISSSIGDHRLMLSGTIPPGNM